MKKKILRLGISGLLLLVSLSATSTATLGVNAMEKIYANYPDNIIFFDDPVDQNEEDFTPEPRVLVPPSEESLKLTQEQVQAFDCATVEDVPVSECEALVALYASTNGAGWTNNTNWLQSTTIGEWYGVSVTASYNGLTVLSLSENNLIGTIPPEIENLSELKILTLSKNFLTGQIPPGFFNLPNLLRINLSENLLTGAVPQEFGKGDYIVIILGSNLFTGQIPPELGEAQSLQYLDLSDNQLTGTIPDEIGQLWYLYTLKIANNKIEGVVPQSLTNLSRLGQGTDFGYNRLNVPQEEPIQSFLNAKDPDWYMTQAIEATIPCHSGGEIISRNGRVKIGISKDACEGEVDLQLTPIMKPSHSYLPMFWARNSFELNAWNEQGAITQFQKPLTFTLYYSDGGIGPVPEDFLTVEMFDEEDMVWRDAAQTCSNGAYMRNHEENWVRLPVCHLTEFGLFNYMIDLPFRLYVPIGMK